MSNHKRPQISLLVTDLDNTLYDWVGYFARSFGAMAQRAQEILGIPMERLLDEFKEVHQCYHNSEQPFALLETQTVKDKFAGMSRQERKQILDSAFYAFNKERKNTLRLFDGVDETLQAIVQSGCVVVGHTEATVHNACFRMRSLGLERFLSRLYAIEPLGDGHPDPERAEAAMPDPSFVRIVQRTKRKPNPVLLSDICAEFSVPPSEVAYVGDSLTRDVSMAKAAGVWAVWAKYGTQYDRNHWKTLVRVTHWTEEDVRREAELQHKLSKVRPDFEIDSFGQVLSQFVFKPPKTIAASTNEKCIAQENLRGHAS